MLLYTLGMPFPAGIVKVLPVCHRENLEEETFEQRPENGDGERGQ